ncbi:MAG: hypothetical protein Q8P89_01185 [bacterium]|nr:hypothetical protein [bacterium]
MGSRSGYYSGEKRKLSKKQMEERAKKLSQKQGAEFQLPEIVKKKQW